MNFADEIEFNKEEIIKDSVAAIMDDCVMFGDYTRTTLRQRGAELAHPCLALGTFRLKYAESKGMKGYPVIAATSGNAVEEVIKRNLIGKFPNNVLLWDEFIPSIKKMGLAYSGKLDLMLNIQGIGRVVVDIKTAQRIKDEVRVDVKDILSMFADNEEDFAYNIDKAKGSVRKSPLNNNTVANYLAQIVGYCTFTDTEHGMMFAISRSKDAWSEPMTTRQEYVFVTDEMKYDTVARVMLRQRLAEKNTIPASPSHFRKTTTCKYCDFKDNCYAGKDEDKFRFLSEEQTSKAMADILPEATELYEEYRGTLKWITNKKIEEATQLKNTINNPTQEAIAHLLETTQIPVKELLYNLESYYEMDSAEQFRQSVRLYNRDGG